MHHRTSPAFRGLGAVDNVTSMESGGYRSYMWYRTKSLQRRVSIWDHLHLLLARSLCWALSRHLGGTSVGWPPVRLRICRSDDAAAGVTTTISLLSMLPTAVRRRLVVVEQFTSPLGRHGFARFFLVFVGTLVTVEA